MWNELSHRVVSADLLRIGILFRRICMHGLVVDSMRSTGASTTELVDRYPGEDLVVGPGVGICPVVQLLIDPCEQCYRGVIKRVGQRLRLGGLLDIIAYSGVNS